MVTFPVENVLIPYRFLISFSDFRIKYKAYGFVQLRVFFWDKIENEDVTMP